MFFIDFQRLCIFVSEEHEDKSYYSIEQIPLEVPDAKSYALNTALKNSHLLKYVNDFLPASDLLFTPWYQSFELIGQNNLFKTSSEGWSDIRDSEKIKNLIVIAQDTSDGFITDISEQNCPVFLYDEVTNFQPQGLANSMYDFIFLLLLREYGSLIESLGESSEVIFESDFAQKYDLSKLDYVIWLRQLAPEYQKNWL